MMTDRLGPLSGVRVLDMSRVLAGPWAAQMLGDLGATVFKVERPGSGDDTRRWGPPFLEDGSGDAAYFTCANRNKEALAIDFAKPEGADLVRRLAAQSDVLVENFKPGALKRYGLDYGSLSVVNPKLVYCSITGFGQTGPYSTRGGYDFLIQGMGGLMSVTGHPEGVPTKVGVPVVDLFTGVYAANSILAALYHQQRTGEGQHIDAALLDTQVSMLANQAASYLNGGILPGRLGNGHPTVVPYRDFKTSDGVVLVTVGNDRQFMQLCELLGRADILADLRFASNSARLLHRDQLEEILGEEIARWSSADFLASLDAAGLAGGPINTLEGVFADSHVLEREMVESIERAEKGVIKAVRYPHRFSRTPTNLRLAPPTIGEHTSAVLTRELGLNSEALKKLKDASVIQCASDNDCDGLEGAQT